MPHNKKLAEIKRYTCTDEPITQADGSLKDVGCRFEESETGEMASYSDFTALQQEVETLQPENERLQKLLAKATRALLDAGYEAKVADFDNLVLKGMLAHARQETLEEAAKAARTLVECGVTPDGIYHTIRALQPAADTGGGRHLSLRR